MDGSHEGRIEAFKAELSEARDLLESAPDALIVIGADGHIALVNGQAEELFGYRRDELVGHSIDVLVPEAVRSRHEQHRADYGRAPATRPMGSGIQQRARRKDGSEFPAEVSLSPVRGAVGLSVIAAIRDLSERQRMEAAIRESAITLDSIGDAVVSTDEHGRVRLMNRIAEALTGWTAAEARGRPMDDVVVMLDERTGQRVAPNVERLGRSGQVDPTASLVLRSRSGADRPIADSIAHITDDGGNEHGMVLVFRDVTDARRAEALLYRSRRELQEIVDKIPEGVLISDGPFVAFANPALERCLGYGPGELAGQRLDALVAPEDRALLAASPLTPVDDGGASPSRFELRFQRKGAGKATLAVTPVQAVEFEGRPACLSLAHDVTAEKQLQAQLILADRMVSIGMLAAGLAHEINNPLTAVIANLTFAIEAARSPAVGELGELGQRLLEDLFEAQQAADRVRSIVREVKILSHADQDQRWPVDVNQTLDSSARIASTELRYRNLRVVKHYGTLPPVMASESRLGQVFLNLIINAFQAIPEDAERAEVRLTTRVEPSGRVVIEVADNGQGMSQEVLARLFTPFFTTKPIGVGTGLGLSISQSIVTGLGGDITVESTPGVGSVFRVRLPAAPPTRSSARPPLAETAPEHRPRVLVVDDEPLIGRAIARLLGADHDVTVVTSGADALRETEAADFDTIVCDLMMPGMTGMELHATLSRSAPDLARRMIFMTGGPLLGHVRELIEGIDHPCLEKPFDIGQLRALIAERLRPVERA